MMKTWYGSNFCVQTLDCVPDIDSDTIQMGRSAMPTNEDAN